MKMRIFCLLMVLTMIMGLSGCGTESLPTETEDSLYESVIGDEESSAADIAAIGGDEESSAADIEAIGGDEESSAADIETIGGDEESELKATAADEQPASETAAIDDDNMPQAEYVEYWFRTKKLRDQHYEKHGVEMGFADADAYRKAASDVVNNPDALHKIEQEDGDDVYYVEATNELVVVSTDGYLRTYFKPDRGKAYFDKQ